MGKPITDNGGVATADDAHNENVLDSMEWTARPVLLRFRIGEIVLGYFRASGVKNATHVSSIAPIESPKAPQTIPDGIDGVTILSCPVAAKLPKLTVRSGWIRYVTWQYRHQMVRIAGNFADYEQKWRSKTRSTLRRKVRRFREIAGRTDYFRIFREPEEMDRFYEDARQVSALSYQERLLGQGIPDSEDYCNNLVERARRGQFLGFVLYLEERPVAYTAGDVMGPGVIRYGQTGYDPAVARHSPGTVLQYLLIQALFESRQFKYYDLCIGEDDSKRLFSNFERDCADIVFLRAGLKNRSAVLCHIASEAVNDAAVSILKKLGVKQVIKRAIRRMA